ncbi:interleukin-20 receptor subunit alpha-like isoform X3 [Calypte anna]|uniref:interleukin-20 receptor subunit alpha-like isoform X3 n=1 Tax=Calypte anna TaxID=9244 RepID=UPI0011C4398A|nr:interleukin-20 receptor subunit alpha-like isoform X3 [Calypte anna]
MSRLDTASLCRGACLQRLPLATALWENKNTSSPPRSPLSFVFAVAEPVRQAGPRTAAQGCGRWPGHGGMSPAFSLLLALAGCTLLRGKLLPPRDVRLEAQNFHVHLRWEPGPDAPSGAMYQVEWRRRNSRWIKAHACWGNSTSSSWACELHFVNIYDIYWARVRAVARGKLSKWASSSELQPYRDTVVGPPTLSWLLQGQILSVNIITPLTPYRSRAGTYRRVDRVLRKLWYRLHLHEGEVLVQEVSCKWSGEGAQCTVGPLKTSTHYCIRTVAVDMARQSREAEQCMVTPPDPTSFPWFIVLLSVIFPLLILAGLCFIQLQVFPSSSETHLPKTLQALLNQELSVTREVPTLELQEDSLSLFLPSMSTSCRPPVAEEPAPTVQLLLGGSLHQDASGYCANGFGPGCHKGSNPSCTHSQAGHALGSQLPLQLEKNGEADGDDVLEQPAGSGKDSCTGRSFIQEGTQEALGLAGHCVLLSSVKLHGSNEEDGGQIVHALQPLHSHGTEPQPCDSSMQPGDSTMLLGHLERAPLSIPSPCQLPLSTLRAAAFSGYELCPWADREP